MGVCSAVHSHRAAKPNVLSVRHRSHSLTPHTPSLTLTFHLPPAVCATTNRCSAQPGGTANHKDFVIEQLTRRASTSGANTEEGKSSGHVSRLVQVFPRQLSSNGLIYI